jgi:hypothetical protein
MFVTDKAYNAGCRGRLTGPLMVLRYYHTCEGCSLSLGQCACDIIKSPHFYSSKSVKTSPISIIPKPKTIFYFDHKVRLIKMRHGRLTYSAAL